MLPDPLSSQVWMKWKGWGAVALVAEGDLKGGSYTGTLSGDDEVRVQAVGGRGQRKRYSGWDGRSQEAGLGDPPAPRAAPCLGHPFSCSLHATSFHLRGSVPSSEKGPGHTWYSSPHPSRSANKLGSTSKFAVLIHKRY